jgi:hypothetical protein
MERGGSDYKEYKEAVKMAKHAIKTIAELTEEMEEEYGYGERGGYYRDERDGMEERGGRGGMRRYR